MEILGYFGAILVGVLVGLVGAGGSIITVPILVYLFHLSPVVATGYALFIVGISSFGSTISYMVRKQVNYRIALLFGIPAVAAVYLTRKFLLPAIPDEIFQVAGYVVTKDLFLMMLLGVLILISATSMTTIKKSYDKKPASEVVAFIYPRAILIEGLIIGILTGFVGTGGGFMIIPALVLLCRLHIKAAIGTALLIASAKSGIGFLGEIGNNLAIDYIFLLKFTGFTFVGIFTGLFFAKKVSGYKLRRAFGLSLFAVGLLILTKELLTL